MFMRERGASQTRVERPLDAVSAATFAAAAAVVAAVAGASAFCSCEGGKVKEKSGGNELSSGIMAKKC